MSTISKAAPGDIVTGIDGNPWTVSEPCQENAGHWYCATHRAAFANQLEKDAHIGSGTHVLAWVCRLHGPEQP